VIRQKAIEMNKAVKMISASVLLLTAGLTIASFFQTRFIIGALLLGLISLICYLLAPVAFELAGDRLVIFSRISKKVIYPIKNCSRIAEPVALTFRLWGNGGLFAITGIYWNKLYGRFSVYLKSSKREDVVLVETDNKKVVISPENVDEFVKYWNLQQPST